MNTLTQESHCESVGFSNRSRKRGGWVSFGEGACIDDSETFENTMKSLEIALVNLRHKLILVSGAIDTGRSSMKKVLLVAGHRRCRLTGKYFC